MMFFGHDSGKAELRGTARTRLIRAAISSISALFAFSSIQAAGGGGDSSVQFLIAFLIGCGLPYSWGLTTIPTGRVYVSLEVKALLLLTKVVLACVFAIPLSLGIIIDATNILKSRKPGK